MKRNRLSAILAGLLFIFSSVSALAAQTTQTAQSIMIDTSGTPTTLAIVNTQQWDYDEAAAALLFTNALDSTSFTSAITDSTTTVNNISGTAPTDESACTPGAPTPPTTPEPIASKLYDGHPGKDDVVGDNACNFLDGNTLSGITYTQMVTTASGSSCTYLTYDQTNTARYKKITHTLTRKDTYTFTYLIAPLLPGYDPLTAWVLQSESNPDGTAHVDVAALLAGESVNVSKNLGTKFSFSLLQNDGLTPRISNVCVAADDGIPDCSGTLTYMDRNPAGATPDLDYLYGANALLCNGTACSSLINDKTALNILNGAVMNGLGKHDTFPGNDNGGANGQALAAMQLSGISLDLLPGDHTLAISATVKENTGAFLGTVGVSLNVNIVTPGCGN